MINKINKIILKSVKNREKHFDLVEILFNIFI